MMVGEQSIDCIEWHIHIPENNKEDYLGQTICNTKRKTKSYIQTNLLF